jgi:hypothetical protein
MAQQSAGFMQALDRRTQETILDALYEAWARGKKRAKQWFR